MIEVTGRATISCKAGKLGRTTSCHTAEWCWCHFIYSRWSGCEHICVFECSYLMMKLEISKALCVPFKLFCLLWSLTFSFLSKRKGQNVETKQVNFFYWWLRLSPITRKYPTVCLVCHSPKPDWKFYVSSFAGRTGLCTLATLTASNSENWLKCGIQAN